MPEVAAVMGTYNRLELLQQSISSIRRAVGALSYAVVVVDGGSTDGTRGWLIEQPDVVAIFQSPPLTGAVKAFNLGFARAVELGAEWVVVLNDDDELIGPGPEIELAVQQMRADPVIGAVAFETDLRGGWSYEEWHGRPYANKGVFRRAAGMAAARAQGNPEGKRWWSEEWATYASDTQLGLLLWRLGWTIERGKGLRVHDVNPQDELRRHNGKTYAADGTVNIFYARWGSKDAADYDPDFAAKHGGLVR